MNITQTNMANTPTDMTGNVAKRAVVREFFRDHLKQTLDERVLECAFPAALEVGGITYTTQDGELVFYQNSRPSERLGSGGSAFYRRLRDDAGLVRDLKSAIVASGDVRTFLLAMIQFAEGSK